MILLSGCLIKYACLDSSLGLGEFIQHLSILETYDSINVNILQIYAIYSIIR
jgi:hypothetical protein